MTTEKDYPYYAEDRKCTYLKNSGIGYTHGSFNITANDEESLK